MSNTQIEHKIQLLRTELMRGELSEQEEQAARQQIKRLKNQARQTSGFRQMREQERVYSWVNVD